MFQALLKGKLSREQENLEDILTSCVFGLFKYLPPKKALVPFLALAQSESDRPAYDFPNQGVKDVTTELWPQCPLADLGIVEPDVKIEFETRGGERHCVFVEVKLHSPKSQHESGVLTDQLAREWYALLNYVEGSSKRPHLLFVTADSHYPKAEVRESIEEFARKKPSLPALQCAWLSWCDVAAAFTHSQSAALRDVAALCARLDLLPFSGIQFPGPVNIAWRYAGASK